MDDDRVRSIVGTLEDACTQIEGELQIINTDLEHAAVCVRRYGDVYLAPLKYLHQLRENKHLRFREIIAQLEGLKTQLDCSNALLNSLNTSQPLTLVPQEPTVHRMRR
jgi:hypothetical protein